MQKLFNISVGRPNSENKNREMNVNGGCSTILSVLKTDDRDSPYIVPQTPVYS